MTSIRAKRIVGLGLLGVALASCGTARAQPPADPEAVLREQLLRLRQYPRAREIIAEFGLGEPLTPETLGIGVAVAPVDATMRAQLELPGMQGVVVTEVAPDGPAAKAGLKPHDILLKLGDDPVSGPEDLDERFRDGGAEPVSVHLVRGGKETTVRVTPRKPPAPRDYYIGVLVAPLSDALRSHLDVAEDQGVVAGDILPESPAAKAGIKPNDILLTIDEKPVRDVEGLVAQVQELRDKTVAVKLLRNGKEKSVDVTPEKRKEPWPEPLLERPRVSRGLPSFVPELRPGWPAPSAWFMGPDGSVRLVPPGQVPMLRGGPGMPTRQLERRLDEMNNQIKELRKAVEDLQKAAKKE